MLRAQSMTEDNPVAEMIESAGDSLVMIIPRAMWETLVRQGGAEGVAPGVVLDKALRAYLEAHGAPEAVDYLQAVARARQ